MRRLVELGRPAQQKDPKDRLPGVGTAIWLCAQMCTRAWSRHEQSILAIAVVVSPHAVRSMHMQKQVHKTVQLPDDS